MAAGAAASRPAPPQRRLLRGTGTVAATVVSGGCVAAPAALLPLPLPWHARACGLGRPGAPGAQPRARRRLELGRIGLRKVARGSLHQRVWRPLAAFLSGAESPFNDGELDTLTTLRDLGTDDVWLGAGPGGDAIVEAVEDLRRQDERRKAHAKLSGHVAVQEIEAVENLLVPALQREADLRNDGTYVDCTFGRGGHSRSILERLSGKGRLYAFDVDPSAVAAGRELEQQDPRFRIFHRPFGEMGEALEGMPINGVLLDVGVSNPQVDEDERGFKISPDAPLDLRMNQQRGVSAAEWLQTVSAEELAWVIHEYGEHKDAVLAERIAESILARQRRLGPFTNAGELADIVKIAKGACDRSMHPAKLTFQAIRIHLNHELTQLRQALDSAFQLLTPGGRCVVIAFKSLESDTVTRFVREHEDPPPEVAKTVSSCRLSELYPLVSTDHNFSVRRINVPFKPRGAEYLNNPRSRSSCLITLLKAARWARRVRAHPRPSGERFQQPEPPPFEGAGSGWAS